jgi:hypothetical protein
VKQFLISLLFCSGLLRAADGPRADYSVRTLTDLVAIDPRPLGATNATGDWLLNVFVRDNAARYGLTNLGTDWTGTNTTLLLKGVMGTTNQHFAWLRATVPAAQVATTDALSSVDSVASAAMATAAAALPAVGGTSYNPTFRPTGTSLPLSIYDDGRAGTNNGYWIGNYYINGGTNLGFAVPFFRPTTTNYALAFDTMPNGANNQGSWIDICSDDLLNYAGTGLNYLHLGSVGASGNYIGYIGTEFFAGGGRSAAPLVMQRSGGDFYVRSLTGTPISRWVSDATHIGFSYNNTDAIPLFFNVRPATNVLFTVHNQGSALLTSATTESTGTSIPWIIYGKALNFSSDGGTYPLVLSNNVIAANNITVANVSTLTGDIVAGAKLYFGTTTNDGSGAKIQIHTSGGNGVGITMNVFGGGSSAIINRMAAGTDTAPTAATTSQAANFGILSAYDGSQYNTTAYVQSAPSSTQSHGTNYGAVFKFNLIPDGTTSFSTPFYITGKGTSVGDGTVTAPTPSSAFSVVSTTRGFLPPFLTTTQKNAITSPVAGLTVFDTTMVAPAFYTGSAWASVVSANVAGDVALAGKLSFSGATNMPSGFFTLIAGTATVGNTSVTTNSVVRVTLKTLGGTRSGDPDIVPTAGVGFSATTASSDTSTYNYVILN